MADTSCPSDPTAASPPSTFNPLPSLSRPPSVSSRPPFPAASSLPSAFLGPSSSSHAFPPSQSTQIGFIPSSCLPTPAPGGVCCVAPWASTYRPLPGVAGLPGSGVLTSCIGTTPGAELNTAAADDIELKPGACRKKIRSLRDLSCWTTSHSHKEYIRFLKRLSGAVSDRSAVRQLRQLPVRSGQASEGAAHTTDASSSLTPEERARALAAQLISEQGNESLPPVSDTVIGVLKLLLQLSDWIGEIPPVEQPMRFGNRAFRTWHQRLKERCRDLLDTIIPSSPAPPPPPRSVPVSFDAIPEEESETPPQEDSGDSSDASLPTKGQALSDSSGAHTDSNQGEKRKETSSPSKSAPRAPVNADERGLEKLHASTTENNTSVRDQLLSELEDYCCHAFGDNKRLDYGTGHEVAFGIFLFVLFEAQVLQSPSDDAAAVLLIFTQYVELCHKLQVTYSLEPAGSRGAWGLDDFHFLPFLFGSAQLASNHFIHPAQITDAMIVHELAPTNLYFCSVEYVTQTKKGAPFSECAPMLYDISGVSTWRKIHTGLIKMYECEVLAKFPIAQHFLFGSYFPLFLDNDSSHMMSAPSSHPKT